MKNNHKILITILLLFISSILFPQHTKKINSASSVDWRKMQKININNISTWIHWDGRSDINGQNSGFEFPKGFGKYLSKYSGLLWGGSYDDELGYLPRIGGTMDSTSLTPGWINKEGIPINIYDPRVRIYKTRKDYLTADLSAESLDEGRTVEEIRNQYLKDAKEWPANLGAPFDDVNGNGKYDYEIDKPGIPGSGQTLWFVCNDFGIENGLEKVNPFGSQFTKLEMQTTVWAYNAESPYYNTIFKKYKLINKSDISIRDMHIGIYCDQEVGDNFDDFCGYDSVLSLGYAYNSNNEDIIYGNEFPVMGIVLLQGPVTNKSASPDDVAIFNCNKISGKRNLITETFDFYVDNDPIYFKPQYFDLTDFCIVLYNYWQNKYKDCGWFECTELSPMPLSGDPVSGEGWIDGILHRPGNRSFTLSSGPFNLEPGDTQEVVIAQYGTLSNDWKHSLVSVKDMARKLQFDYKNFLYTHPSLPEISKNEDTNPLIPEYFYLSQNYPNPFNPKTEIIYEIPIDCKVTLKIYDMLGREIATLVDEYKHAGSYNSIFNTQHLSLSSGIYVYTLQAGPYFKNRKMILLK